MFIRKRNTRRILSGFLLFVLLTVTASAGISEQPEAEAYAEDITAGCTYGGNSKETKKNTFQLMTDGEWKTIGQSKYLSNWHPLEQPANRIRIRTTSRERLRIAERRK